jgi:transcriptional regulator with XRE-family HTH domain
MKLGSQSGVSFQQIQKYERGINGISASSLLLFAHILKVPVTWFYEEMASNFWNNTHQPPASEANDDILYRRETLALIRAYYRLTKKCRRGFYDFLVSAADEGAEKL